MINKFKEKAKKLWNIINGKDKNFDGKVDIKDKFIAAKRKNREWFEKKYYSKPAKEKK